MVSRDATTAHASWANAGRAGNACLAGCAADDSSPGCGSGDAARMTTQSARLSSAPLRATLDNVANAFPNKLYPYDNANFSHGISYTFIFPSVASGSHTVRIQFHSSNTVDEVVISSHMTVVSYNRLVQFHGAPAV